MKPPISVVMVTCNVETFLAEAIESILTQTFRDFEFVIVDFGSTDKSREIVVNCAERDRRIVFREIPHCSLAEARNFGCRLARGTYIAIMDSDDVSLPDRLQSQFDFMEHHSRVGVLGGATEWIDSAGQSLRIDRFPAEDAQIRNELVHRCPFCQPTILMRSEAFIAVGGYRGQFAQAEDYDLWLRISEHFECANLQQIALKYRIHPQQISMRRNTEQVICLLAAQSSAVARRKGNADPLTGVSDITPALLHSLGVSRDTQQNMVFERCRLWIRHMSSIREYSVALQAATELLNSDRDGVEQWRIADLNLAIAELHWRKREFLKSLVPALRAVAMRPKIVGRPLRPVLRRLRLAGSE